MSQKYGKKRSHSKSLISIGAVHIDSFAIIDEQIDRKMEYAKTVVITLFMRIFSRKIAFERIEFALC